jgi:hypothetical protein
LTQNGLEQKTNEIPRLAECELSSKIDKDEPVLTADEAYPIHAMSDNESISLLPNIVKLPSLISARLITITPNKNIIRLQSLERITEIQNKSETTNIDSQEKSITFFSSHPPNHSPLIFQSFNAHSKKRLNHLSSAEINLDATRLMSILAN